METLRDFLFEMDFNYKINKDNEIQLIDLQGANLGGIEEETFSNVSQIIERLETYIDDYFMQSLGEIIGIDLYYYTYEDMKKLLNDYLQEHKEEKEELEYYNELLDILTYEKELIIEDLGKVGE